MALLVLFLAVLVSSLLSLHFAYAQSDDFSVVAYLPDYRFYINVNATAPFLTDLILFSIQPTEDLSSDACCLSADHYRIARQAQAYNREQGYGELRLWVAVGGGGRSNAFASIAPDKEKRTKLINQLIELCQREGLQGVDFDWEIPRTHQDLQAYVELLLQAAPALYEKGLLVSVALHARQFLPPQVYFALNRINFMAYDLAADHVAPYETVVMACKEFMQYKCPPSRLVLGIPAYARHSTDPGNVKSFAELMDDSNGEAASTTEWSGYRFDSPESIERKIAYALDNDMAGIFFWELGQDKQHAELGPGGVLLEAAAKSVATRRQQGGNTEL